MNIAKNMEAIFLFAAVLSIGAISVVTDEADENAVTPSTVATAPANHAAPARV